MIVLTSQDYNMILCGDCCPAITCASPQLSCQSITIPNCGYTLPNLSSVPFADSCLKYTKRKREYIENENILIVDTPPGNTYQSDSYTMRNDTFITVYLSSGCGDKLTNTEYINTQSVIDGPTGAPTSDVDYSAYSSYSIAGGCTGEMTYTDNLCAANNYTEPLESCVVLDGLGIPNNEDWTYTSRGIFNYGFSEPDYTFDASYTYSDPTDIAWFKTQLDSLNFDISKNGASCKSIVVSALSCVGSFESATKARYKVGIPASYGLSSLSATNSSTYNLQWQEVFFSPLSSVAPVLKQERSWEWDGNLNNPFSDWFYMDLPTEVGETRVVNMLIQCYKSSKFGFKPTSSGEIVVL